MNEQMKKWLLQSTSDEAFFAMTREEDERCNRLAFKAQKGIVDDEVIAADERHYRNNELLFGKEHANKLRERDLAMFGKRIKNA